MHLNILSKCIFTCKIFLSCTSLALPSVSLECQHATVVLQFASSGFQLIFQCILSCHQQNYSKMRQYVYCSCPIKHQAATSTRVWPSGDGKQIQQLLFHAWSVVNKIWQKPFTSAKENRLQLTNFWHLYAQAPMMPTNGQVGKMLSVYPFWKRKILRTLL